jgi:hypothetical protein
LEAGMTEGLTEEQRAALTDEELRALDASAEEPLRQEDIDEPPEPAESFALVARDSAIANQEPVTQTIITKDDFTEEDVKALAAEREGEVS